MSDEGGHWYRRDGSPCYEVPKKDGGMRSVNLRWDRPLLLVPSVTTVTQIIAKPQLEKWKREQSVLAALTLPSIEGESSEAWLARIDADSRTQVEAAAAEGTRIHDACEAFYKGRPVPAHYVKTVDAVVEEVSRLFPGVRDWVSEKSFAHPMGYGGKVDLHSPSTGHVVDFKGKDGDFSDGKKLAWDQHWQLAAYQEGLELPRTDCANVFFSRTHQGKATSYKWTSKEIEEGWQVFAAALPLWRALKRYDPRFNRRAAMAA